MAFEVAYQGRWIRERPEPRDIAEELARAGVLRDYLLYERQGEARIACDCLARVTVSADSIRLERESGETRSEPADDPFKQVESFLGSLPLSHWTAYGYVGFDVSKFYFQYPRTIAGPLLQFIIPRFEVRITAESVTVLAVDGPGADIDLETIADLIAHPGRSTSPTPTPPVLEFEDRRDYCSKVEALTRAIRDGVLQKAILSRCVRVPGSMDILATYASSSLVNNAHRSYCFRLGDMGGVGFSPEILLEARGRGRIATNPLAGTRPRGADPSEDASIRGELFTDPKEVKEHALSVLLAQEEIGSVCAPDSVRVHDFMEVKKFRCVQHLSSRVAGTLRPECTLWDALRVLFPGVTVSGIPKAPALRWISELESEPRGIYAGAVGWVDGRGRADLAIAIRSAFQYGDTLHLNAGAGIVAESVPEREYVESVNKMNTMLSQIVMARGQGA
jgi:salicylate synthetase